MPLFEYYCGHCKRKFEFLANSSKSESPICPKCKRKSDEKLISQFAVGGQGDLRETTLHGCHDAHVDLEPGHEGHDHHDHHDHGSDNSGDPE
jgi:putative FmdB family regulatory protein